MFYAIKNITGADPEILKGGCTKFSGPELPCSRFDPFFNLLWLPPFEILSSILVYGDAHKMKQYLLFWFILYFDCFSYKIISTIQYFPGSDGKPWHVLSYLLEFIILVKNKIICYTMHRGPIP